jgi:hypothetical protein
MACWRFSVPPSKKILRKFAGPANNAFRVFRAVYLRPSTGSGHMKASFDGLREHQCPSTGSGRINALRQAQGA